MGGQSEPYVTKVSEHAIDRWYEFTDREHVVPRFEVPEVIKRLIRSSKNVFVGRTARHYHTSWQGEKIRIVVSFAGVVTTIVDNRARSRVQRAQQRRMGRGLSNASVRTRDTRR